MIRKYLIISFALHVLGISCFSFSLKPYLNLADLYSFNFLGSFLKEADFLFDTQSTKAASQDQNSLNILLKSKEKSITLYNREAQKPLLAAKDSSSQEDEISSTYRRIETTLESKKLKGQAQEIKPANWEKVKLRIE